MGREEADKKARQTLGKYNVTVKLVFMTPQGFMEEKINCRTWNHAGTFLALELHTGQLRVVNLRQYHGFTVSNMDEDDMREMERMN